MEFVEFTFYVIIVSNAPTTRTLPPPDPKLTFTTVVRSDFSSYGGVSGSGAKQQQPTLNAAQHIGQINDRKKEGIHIFPSRPDTFAFSSLSCSSSFPHRHTVMLNFVRLCCLYNREHAIHRFKDSLVHSGKH